MSDQSTYPNPKTSTNRKRVSSQRAACSGRSMARRSGVTNDVTPSTLLIETRRIRYMSRHCSLILTSVSFLAVTLADNPSRAASESPPNIILILADDLSANVLSSYGGESARTPVLDQLATEGLRYTHCYSPQLCMPSRCELLTGKYSHRNFVGRGHVADGETTVASELKKAGYATCQIEKWHLNINGGAMPTQVGFDEYFHTKLAHNYFGPVVDVNGEVKTFKDGYGPKVCQSFAFDFIKRHRDQPFFLFYAMHLPHAPFHEPPGFDLVESPSNSEKYIAMVAHQDALIGDLVKHLESLQLRERTLLIFTGDNGTPHGIHYRANGNLHEGAKGALTDGGTHVPLIVNWPGTISKGLVTDALVDFADFLPTLMEAAGQSARPAMGLDGQSYYRQLLGDSEAPVRDACFKFGCQNGGKGAMPVHGYWARTQRWKLYNNGHFYDLRNDPGEERPIELGSANGDAVSAHGQLMRVLNQSGADAVLKRFRKKKSNQKK